MQLEAQLVTTWGLRGFAALYSDKMYDLLGGTIIAKNKRLIYNFIPWEDYIGSSEYTMIESHMP